MPKCEPKKKKGDNNDHAKGQDKVHEASTLLKELKKKRRADRRGGILLQERTHEMNIHLPVTLYGLNSCLYIFRNIDKHTHVTTIKGKETTNLIESKWTIWEGLEEGKGRGK